MRWMAKVCRTRISLNQRLTNERVLQWPGQLLGDYVVWLFSAVIQVRVAY